MQRLSSPIQQLKNHYTVVVVGSGYGGGISASRLSRAGNDVCILERGREYIPGEYPNTQAEIVRETQLDVPEGHIGSRAALLDFHINKDINVLVGCGLGGTSLINANVAAHPDTRVFDDPRWPAAFRSDSATKLADGYTRATQMLTPSPYPDHFPAIHKLQGLETSAKSMNGSFYRLPINVTFEDKVNAFGVEQHACVACGDCVSGCNYGAKNTTLMNYLPDARNHGAEIYTEVCVRYLERKGDQWLVHYQLVESGQEKFDAPTMFVSADIVVLAAGALGSTEILLRSKTSGLVLSNNIGSRFTGNGDVLGFTYNSKTEINGIGFGPNNPTDREPVGPCITGIIDLRNTPQLQDGMVIEEGSVPGAVADLLPLTLSSAAVLLGKDVSTNVADAVEEKGRELETLLGGPYVGATKNTQTYLVMAHDDGAGQMVLEDDRLRINWPGVGGQPVFERINQQLLNATKPLGGAFVPNPSWSKLTNQNLTSVHPLGGCIMAETADQGVVNHKGQVFAGSTGADVYDSLYVSDGSIIPRPLGINPLLTISAIAERSCALMAADRGWTIDYSMTTPSVKPSQAFKPAVRFTETMKGFFSTAVKDDFQKGFDRGQQDNSPIQFVLTITADDAEFMLSDSKHESRAVGTVTAPALSPEPMTVSEGVFQLFVEDPTSVETRNMIYMLKLATEEGKTYFFRGVKLIHDDHSADAWKDTTTLFTTIYDGDSTASPALGKGILVIQPQDFAIQLQTMQVLNVDDDQQRWQWLLKVGQFFTGVLFDTYGPVVDTPNQIDPTKPPKRKKRPLRMSAPELYYPVTSDKVTLQLTRYCGGKKGPVVLSPGFGVSTESFSTDTVDTNLPEYLYANGYDVWLFDYRASPRLPSSSTLFSLDDIAQKDYPAAIGMVRQISGAPSVQVVVHCVGSMTFLMAMMSGLEGVRQAVCSQLGLFPVTSTLNQVKAGMHAAGFLLALGQKTVDTNLPPNDWRNILADVVIQMFPPEELCKSTVCHQVRIIYGESYKHDQLNSATHDALYEMFGVSNIRTFNHILTTVLKGQVVDEQGNDVYMPNVGMLKIPISFVQGVQNQLFLPEGTHKTFQYLCQKNGSDNYIWITFPNYGHMDCFVGKTAVTDIYPIICSELGKTN
jgi:cholesterol oxidase